MKRPWPEIHADPGVGAVGPGQAGLARRGVGLEVATHIAGGKAGRTKGADHHVGEVLADALPQLEHFVEGRGDIGRLGVEREVGVDASIQIEHRVGERPFGGEGPRAVGGQRLTSIDQRRVDRVLEGREVAGEARIGRCGERLPRAVSASSNRLGRAEVSMTDRAVTTSWVCAPWIGERGGGVAEVVGVFPMMLGLG